MTNYDGQGKTAQQETDESLTMLILFCAWLVIVVGLIVYVLWE